MGALADPFRPHHPETPISSRARWTRGPRRLIAWALAAVAATTACGGGEKALAPADAALVGTWTLVAFNDRPLPTDLPLGPNSGIFARSELREGSLVLRPDWTWVRTERRRGYRADGSVIEPDAVRTDVGEFTASGASLTFSTDFGPGVGVKNRGEATVAGTRLTYVDRLDPAPAPRYAYEKR